MGGIVNMIEEKILHLLQRQNKLIRKVIDLERINTDLRYFMDNTIEITLETTEYVETTLNENNAKINKAWKLYKVVKNQINML